MSGGNVVGLGRVVRSSAVALAAVAAGVVAGAVVGVGPGAVAAAGRPMWRVTVGAADRTLFPGTNATMAYTVRNDTGVVQRLHATTARFKSDGVHIYDSHAHAYAGSCLSRWFNISRNDVASDVDVGAGQVVDGVLTLTYDDAGTVESVCRGIGLEVVVDAS